MKRFWADVVVVSGAEGFTVQLDGKDLRLPAGGRLLVPYPALAAAIATEWRDAGAAAAFSLEDLNLTRLATTAQLRVRPCRADIIGQLAAYADADLLCYRADQPAAARREAAAWQPWLDWAAARYGVVLPVTSGVMPAAANPADRRRFTAALALLTDYQLAGLGVIIPALGSIVLGLAIAAGALTAVAACDLASLEALTQEEHWGGDDEAAARRDEMTAEVAMAHRFMLLCQP